VLSLVLAIGVVTAAGAPVVTDAELDRLAEPLRSADPAARMHAAETLAAQPGESLEVLATRLLRPSATHVEIYRRLFLAMWGQVPNWKGYDPMWIRRPEPPWTPPPRVPGQPRAKRPPPHDPETLDWLKALNEVDLTLPELVAPIPIAPTAPTPAGTPTAPLDPLTPTVADLERARAEAMERVALMRALAASKRLDAVDPIFQLAFQLDGVFRDECGRQLRSMDSFAVPALIRLMYEKGTPQQHLAKQRRYASYQLDRMDRARPQKAISTAPDDRVRAAIVHAYGEESALDAVEAILGQVDAPSHRVRKEARWAWLRYVTGKPPPPAPKRKRKLPGGREEEEEKPDYLTYREIAELALRKELEAINGEPADAKATVAALTEELFAYYDRQHAAEWNQQFEAAREKERAGDVKAASDEYGWILAHDPNYARRGEMAHAFARRGDELRAARRISEALGYYRQAIDLDPKGPEVPYAAARVAMLDGLQALDLGHADPGLFHRALALDPTLDDARAGLARAESQRSRRRWAEAGEAAAALLVLGFALWFLWRRAAERGKPIAS
jgi:tetratricopeptide (TPR) repeat protein